MRVARARPTKTARVRVARRKKIDSRRVRGLRRSLLRWFAKARRNFYWREAQVSPFAVLLSEILLARTRAEAVEPVVRQLVGRFPEPADIAQAGISDIETILHPLGLHRTRARLIVKCAAHLVEHHRGEVPTDIESLMSLPYVGRYAASSVACVAFDKRVAVLDANVARVYQRLFALPALRVRITDAKHLWVLAERMISPNSARDFNWAILDLGGLVCKARNPTCEICPLRRQCLTGIRNLHG